jgi:hypothetical protein
MVWWCGLFVLIELRHLGFGKRQTLSALETEEWEQGGSSDRSSSDSRRHAHASVPCKRPRRFAVVGGWGPGHFDIARLERVAS